MPSSGALVARMLDLERALTSVRAELERSQRLATLGTIAAMVAHEVNNLMTPITAPSSHVEPVSARENARIEVAIRDDCIAPDAARSSAFATSSRSSGFA